jgi:tetratricopeptide (TPR) repeat protein
MEKVSIEKEIEKIMVSLMTGTKEEIKDIQKVIRSLWMENSEKFKKNAPIVLKYLKQFDNIKNPKNQVAFISGLDLFFLSLADDYFEELKDFILKVIQHPNGNVREAIRKASNWAYVSFFARIYSVTWLKVENPTTEQKAIRKKAEDQYRNFLGEIDFLMRKNINVNDNSKYVNEMKPSVQKSLELLWNDVTRNGHLPSFMEKEEDEGKSKEDLYYDAMDCLSAGDAEMARKFLNKAIKIDKNYVAAYMGITATYKFDGNDVKEKEYAELAFVLTRKKFPKWPNEMIWGHMENREYLRAICDKAAVLHKEGKLSEAEELYRILLKLNPNDNQGVRYLIAGLFAGISPINIDKMFDEGNLTQNWIKLEKLVERENTKHKFWKESLYLFTKPTIANE